MLVTDKAVVMEPSRACAKATETNFDSSFVPELPLNANVYILLFEFQAHCLPHPMLRLFKLSSDKKYIVTIVDNIVEERKVKTTYLYQGK